MTTTNDNNKNTILQNTLYNLPKDIVNMIDYLSNEVIPPHFTKLLKDSSIDKLCDILKMFGKRLTNMKNSRIPIDTRRETIIIYITNELNKLDEPTTLVDKISKDHFNIKTKNIEWLKEFVVGEEVLVLEGDFFKGIIKKINPKSVSISMYDYDTIGARHPYGNRHLWKPEILSTKIVYSRVKLFKRGQDRGLDRYF